MLKGGTRSREEAVIHGDYQFSASADDGNVLTLSAITSSGLASTLSLSDEFAK